MYTPATRTLELIEERIAADQGAAFRVYQGQVLPHMADAYRGHEDPYRSHLGASIIGNECARAVWYSFRWYTKPRFRGVTLRLFNRGHLEEGRMIAALMTIGVTVYQHDQNGKQYRISHAGGHFGGSCDGVALGVPDLPTGMPALLEFKTHNDKSFKKLVDEGVRYAKLEHYVQMQMYMSKLGLPAGLYMAVNKNDDMIHAELIGPDPVIAEQFLDRAQKIIYMNVEPTRLSESPGWYQCSWCDHKPVCHLRQRPERNCRTCEESSPTNDGKWFCRRHNRNLSFEEQMAGCADYMDPIPF